VLTDPEIAELHAALAGLARDLPVALVASSDAARGSMPFSSSR
jgi:hypothetical protein